MVGSSNPPMIQSIVDRIKVGGYDADEVMFKLSWTLPGGAFGMFYLRAENKNDRDEVSTRTKGHKYECRAIPVYDIFVTI